MLITIGITSYKRLRELERCLNSIKTKYFDKIEILVSEDHSPLRNEIKRIVDNFASKTRIKVKFNSNVENLGYDRNLGKIIELCNSKYLFFLSDDDIIYESSLDNLIEFLDSDNDFGVVYSPFLYTNNVIDRKHNNSFYIEPSEENAIKYVYDSILFSGLIFNTMYVKNISSDRFLNLNYFQVYLFLTMIFKYGGYYNNSPTVVCIGDGENAYGTNEASDKNSKLIDRNSVISNLEFNKTLIMTLKMFDRDNDTNIFYYFAKQYSLHAYSGLSIARENGIDYFNEYWKTLLNLPIKYSKIVYVYYYMLLLFGKKTCDCFFVVLKRLFNKGIIYNEK